MRDRIHARAGQHTHCHHARSISYLAWIHYYTIMCFLCVFGVVVQVVLVHVIDPGAEGIERVEDLEVSGSLSSAGAAPR